MEISKRMASMNPSAIREMLKVSAKISFSAGTPSQETFPTEELSALSAEIFKNESATALSYGITEGYEPLRRLVWGRLTSKYNVGNKDIDDVIITTGGQQGIDLAIKCLTNEGDSVICENPSFIGALNDFRSYNVKIHGVSMDDDGMNLDEVENLLKTKENIKMIYTISTFQNPSGITMSLEKRQRLYDLAVKYDVVILEDNPYFELRYSGEDIPNIKALDKTGHVVFVGSFSKIISPGIRVGYTIVKKEIASKMTVAKQVQDIHSNLFFMMLIAKYLERYDIDKHIAECCKLYASKRDLMIECLEKHLPSNVTFTRPDGGLYIWCELPEGYSGTELCQYTNKHSVAVVPGICLDIHEDPNNAGFRLNFSVPTHEEIKLGIELLGQSVKEYLSSK